MTVNRKLCFRCNKKLPDGDIKEYACYDCAKKIVQQVGGAGPLVTVALNSIAVAFSVDTGKLVCVASVHAGVQDGFLLSVTGWAVIEAQKAERKMLETAEAKLKNNKQISNKIVRKRGKIREAA